MKFRNYLLTAAFTPLAFASFGQAKTIVYKCGQWLDTKTKGFANAYRDPTYEKVEILQTQRKFKVTFGSKMYDYTIVSSNRFSNVQTRYNVIRNGKSYLLAVSENSPETYSIGIDEEWIVYPISNVSIVDAK